MRAMTNDASQRETTKNMKNLTTAGPIAAAVAAALLVAPAASAEPKPSGRIHLDYGLYDEDATPMNDAFHVRRARIALADKLDDLWSYKTEVDFAENGVAFKDMYLKRGNLTIGQTKVPFSLDEQTSSNNITFMERASPTVFSLAHRLGVTYGTSGDNYTFKVMGFGQAIGEGDGGDEGLGLGGRITYAPMQTDTGVLHLGASAVSYEPTNSVTDTMRFRQRPESRPDGSRLVDTGDITNVDRAFAYGLEGAWQSGPFSVQGEYIGTKVARNAGNPDVDLDGYYVAASWFLTGERRSYSGGVFGGPKIADPARGAWELAARYSDLGLDDGAVLGGEMKNVTLGVNWYARSGVRFMLNYVNATSTVAGIDNDPSIVQLRAQVSF